MNRAGPIADSLAIGNVAAGASMIAPSRADDTDGFKPVL